MMRFAVTARSSSWARFSHPPARSPEDDDDQARPHGKTWVAEELAPMPWSGDGHAGAGLIMSPLAS
ncbi:MAG: hypothetical protein INH41_11260 [Myxococcaceae bacterium]|jgi:hypothetical protein|nr:hypothetical protein [Myxococcaceae bacterium]MCA3012959.1 hypothetical protein [Myxococcaceae bacterium]